MIIHIQLTICNSMYMYIKVCNLKKKKKISAFSPILKLCSAVVAILDIHLHTKDEFYKSK